MESDGVFVASGLSYSYLLLSAQGLSRLKWELQRFTESLATHAQATNLGTTQCADPEECNISLIAMRHAVSASLEPVFCLF